MSGGFFVPHDLNAPMQGATSGPLAGLTAVVKDMYDIAGTRTGGGNPEWLEKQQPAARNAAVVEQILAAGATITGKTICERAPSPRSPASTPPIMVHRQIRWAPGPDTRRIVGWVCSGLWR